MNFHKNKLYNFTTQQIDQWQVDIPNYSNDFDYINSK